MNIAYVKVIKKTGLATDVVIPLATNLDRFKSITFFGGKGTAETSNTGTVYVCLKNYHEDVWVNAFPVIKNQWSAAITAEMMGGWSFTGEQIGLKASVADDGILALVTFSLIRQ